jgi:hypothetical protein
MNASYHEQRSTDMGIRIENNHAENQYFEQQIDNQTSDDPGLNLIIDVGEK